MTGKKIWKIIDVSGDVSRDYEQDDEVFSDFADFVVELAIRFRDGWHIATSHEWTDCCVVLMVAPHELRHHKEE